MASVHEGDSHDLRIVLLGVSGAGKSPTANAILGREAFRESRTRESEIQRGRVEDRNISIIDTPGFFNTQLTDEEQQKQMMKSLDLSHPGPHVFLLLIRLETFRDDQRNIVEQIEQNFGEEALLFTTVLFVGREKISKREWIEIKENEETRKMLKYFEGRFYIMNSKNECDPNQITKLLRKIEEMVGNNEGRHYSNETYIKTKFGNQEVRAEQEVVQEMQEEEKTKIPSELDIKPESMGDSPKQDDEGKQETASLRIILLGKTGSGRSSSGNTILGRNAFRVSFLSFRHSCEKQEAVVSGRTISILDTPGLLDSRWYRCFQDELERDIEECLNMSAPGPHVFLLVVRLNGRHTEDEKNTAKWIQENFGEDALCHTIVLFTHADFLIGESLDQYMRKSPDLQSLIDSCGGRFHSFNNQDGDNQSEVTELLEKIDKLVKDNREAYHPNEKSRKKKQGEMRNDNIREATETQQALHGLHRAHLLTLMMELEMSEMALRLSLARAVAQSRRSRQDLRIVLLGFLASGKSSTANTILGREAFKASVVSTTLTCERQAAEKSGRTISITDSPPITVSGSLFSGNQQSEVEKSLEMCAPGPHVFLLVIGMEGLANVENNPAKWFQENLEKDALNHTVVLFTHADLLNRLINGPLNEYFKENLSLKSLIDSCGGRYHLLDNKEIQNRLQVTVLLMKIDEMVQKNGGKHYTRQNIFKRAPKSKPLATKKQDASDCEIL